MLSVISIVEGREEILARARARLAQAGQARSLAPTAVSAPRETGGPSAVASTVRRLTKSRETGGPPAVTSTVRRLTKSRETGGPSVVGGARKVAQSAWGHFQNR